MLQEDIYQQAVDKIKNVLKSQLDEDGAQALQDMVTRIVAQVWLQHEHARLVITRRTDRILAVHFDRVRQRVGQSQ